MRYFLLAEACLANGKLELPVTGRLVTTPSGPTRRLPGRFAAAAGTIAITSVAATAQKEHLTTTRPGANYVAQRFHVPESGSWKTGLPGEAVRRRDVSLRPRGVDQRARSSNSGPSLYLDPGTI